MKTYISILLFLFSISISAQDINWMSLNEAIIAQEKEPRKIMLDVYTDWCGPCKLLDKKTFQNKDVAKYVNENYYAVKFNAEGDEKIMYKEKTYTNPKYDATKRGRNSVHDFTIYMKVGGYPTIVFMDEKSDLITGVTGFLNPQQLELYLKLFADDTHKDFKTQEDVENYQKNFKPVFKG